jgi:hypothetical protein
MEAVSVLLFVLKVFGLCHFVLVQVFITMHLYRSLFK